MAVNPYNNRWYKPTKPQPRLNDLVLLRRWQAIEKHLKHNQTIYDQNGMLKIMPNIYVAKHSVKFRLQSYLDWAYYTPKTLADAINNNSVDVYYEVMLKHQYSDPNEWGDNDFEQYLKSYYAARQGRASLI